MSNIPNVTSQIKVHNNFTFELIDSITGKVKQRAKAENVVCNRFYTQAELKTAIAAIRLGTGSGTPAVTDTTLFAQKYILSVSSANHTTREYSNDTMEIKLVATSPLGNTGVYTEVGLGASYSEYGLLTHAMITDSEGEPITIEQTSTDILTINAYVYITLTFTDTLQTYIVRPAKYLTEAYAGTTNYNYIINNTARIYLATCVNNHNGNNVDALQLVGAVDGNSGSRIGVNSGNNGYYNYMCIAPQYGLNIAYPVGYIQFPNASVFPPYNVTGLSIGTGDGTTTQFKAPLDLFIANSDVIKVNGVTKTRGTDYTISNNTNNNRRKCISAGNFAKDTYHNPGDFSSNRPWFSLNSGTFYSIAANNNTSYLELDLTALDDKRVNYIMPPTLGYYYIGRDYTFDGTAIFSKSDDGITFTDVATISFTSGIPSAPAIFNTPIIANYWRVRLASHSGSFYVYNNSNSFFGYTEEYAITFTTAPADGAVITMDCQLDRPYKSENYVIDLQGTLTVTKG